MNPNEKIQTYKPNLIRGFSTLSATEDVMMASDAQAFITQPVRRGRSLVRPERERIGENHRQYHYRQAAGQAPVENVQPSTTGNLPSRTLSRRGTTKSHAIRRGKSVLGREEKVGTEDEFAYEGESDKKGWFSKLPGLWMTYCYLLTCCVPPQILSLAGNTKKKTS
jgi:chitin synthase